MRWSSWAFSAKLAWGRLFFKILTIFALVHGIASSVVFLVIVLPRRDGTGMMVFHYNVYQGVDQFHPWWWLLFLPGIWLLLTVIDIILAFGSYRDDPQLAWSLLGLACLCGIPWSMAFYYLALMNV